MTNNRLDSMALPEVGIIRKGDAKTVEIKDGREVQMVGKDLKDKFRVHFFPGCEEYQEAFLKNVGDLRPKRIRVMFLATSVWKCWSWYNEGYNAGRLLIKADDNHYITWKDGVTGEYIVRDGQPLTEFKPGQVYTYTKNGKTIAIKPRTMGRLRMWVPKMARGVQLVLKTTSYYDRLNIDRQLATIQLFADTLNGGNAAGIPIDVFRLEQEITWNKPDGSAARVKKWLVNIEVDPEWLQAASKRLANFAFTGEVVAGLLEPPTTIEGSVEPELDEDEVDENPNDAEFVDAQARDVPAEAPAPEPPMTYEIAAAILVERKVKAEDGTEVSEQIRMDNLNKGQLEFIVVNSKDTRKVKAAEIVLEHDYNLTRPDAKTTAAQDAVGGPAKE